MDNHISEYLKKVNVLFKTGNSTEHSYRGDLQQLIEHLVPDVLVTNEPTRIACGAPDYILTKKGIPVGYVEAKDIGKDLESKDYKEQFGRYRKSLDNIIFTDYLDFRLYKHGEFVTSIKLAEIVDGAIVPQPNNYDQFISLLKDFSTHIGQTIKSPSKLSVMMADKAKMLAQVIDKALTSDEENEEDSTLKEQMNAFKNILIHDIKPKQFADIYAQTIAYGMFAARVHDKELDTFSRQEAAEKIPKSNPFLRKLFQYIAGYDLDHRIVWIVDELADVFRATDVKALLKGFGKSTQQHDPIIHFYETFLAEYDPKLRKARGVWYTPEPVVNFIVRAVDDILKDEFGLAQGLADTTKTKIKLKIPTHDKRSKSGLKEIEQEVHKVQILDPATGTGTFLAEVIKQVYKRFESQQGIWSSYVENHLIPRLNGFELLMASYAMAHLKLDLLLTETGYKPTKDQRLRIYLTNSLEEHHKDTGTLFAGWLSSEANEANHIKRDTPVMVIMGNPPYSGESANKGEWIMNLMKDYKKEPDSKNNLQEKNSKFINDDYVKFLRYGQHYIERNGEGIVAFINPHGFLDNPTFRGMRWNLLKTYDKIITIDLHGNAKKKEVAPDGTPDVNVFDIQQGVSVNIFIKTGTKEKGGLAEVFHFDVFGKRENKYKFLLTNSINDIKFQKIKLSAPQYLFVPKDYALETKYIKGFKIDELFIENSLGLLTKRDKLAIGFSSPDLERKISSFLDPERSVEEVCSQFGLVLKDKDKWDAKQTRKIVSSTDIATDIKDCMYRPFDNRKVFYNPNFVARPNTRVLQHLIKENLGLIVGRQGQAVGGNEWNVLFITNYLVEQNIYRRGGGTVFPLFLYENDGQQSINKLVTKTPNFKPSVIKNIESTLGITMETEDAGTQSSFSPNNLLDYIYAVLHSPSYRNTYYEFIKSDFPRIPYPNDEKTFWQLVKLGGEIRQLHLLESSTVEDYITTYPNDGDNIITRKLNKNDWEITNEEKQTGRIWINDVQYFDGIPLVAWEFYIGGYQPAQKWLKDRRGRELSFDDILHYQKIIVALNETNRLMQEIDKIKIE
jgi:predicted helicase